MIWSVILGMAGLVFLFYMITDVKKNWWAVIPGLVLLGTGVTAILSVINFRYIDLIAGIIVLGSISLAFWVIYLLDVTRWWAIIPGGVMAILSLISIYDEIPGSSGILDSGSLFFLGLGATFGLVAVLPNGGKRMTWPWIPAGILLLLAMLVSFTSSDMISFVWPVVFIIAGAFLLIRALQPGGQKNG
ncbi:MAG: hypothetical protein JEZ06_02540 [Anaerolineaceae bacterium]|nr:hypothetical protein [Anaerolineaceae bacterium]